MRECGGCIVGVSGVRCVVCERATLQEEATATDDGSRESVVECGGCGWSDGVME